MFALGCAVMKPSGKPAMLYVNTLRWPTAAAATHDQANVNNPASTINVLRIMAQVSTLALTRTARTAAAWGLGAALLCASPKAHANGRYPKADQLVIAADQPE